jgi:hypothetical protein
MRNVAGLKHRFGERRKQQCQDCDPQRRYPPSPVAPKVPALHHCEFFPARTKQTNISTPNHWGLRFTQFRYCMTDIPRRTIYTHKLWVRANVLKFVRFVTPNQKLALKTKSPQQNSFGRSARTGDEGGAVKTPQ